MPHQEVPVGLPTGGRVVIITMLCFFNGLGYHGRQRERIFSVLIRSRHLDATPGIDHERRINGGPHTERFDLTLGTHSCDGGTALPTYVKGRPYDSLARSRVWTLEEKQTDVNLVLAMYRDLAKGRFDQVVLCSNDSHHEPVLRAIRKDFPEITIGVIFPARPTNDGSIPRRQSAALDKLSNWRRRYLLDDELPQAQLPDQIATKRNPIRRPSH